MLKVRDIMTLNPLRIDSDRTVREAVQIMTENKIGSITVFKGKEIVGILEEGDIVRNVLCKDLNPYVAKVGEVMSVPLIISEECSDDEVSELMAKHRVRHVAVSSDSRIIGIVSMYDLMRPIYTGRSFWT
jgi:CBS domain-containing protein